MRRGIVYATASDWFAGAFAERIHALEDDADSGLRPSLPLGSRCAVSPPSKYNYPLTAVTRGLWGLGKILCFQPHSLNFKATVFFCVFAFCFDE